MLATTHNRILRVNGWGKQVSAMGTNFSYHPVALYTHAITVIPVNPSGT